MNIWYVRIPGTGLTEKEVYFGRSGMLIQKLIEHGHKILWWTSAFDHQSKSWFFDKDTRTKFNDNLEIYSMKGKGYKKNVSFARLRENRILAKKLKTYAENEELPDIIVVCTPPYEIAAQAVEFANEKKIPIVVDMRDDLPDLFVTVVPKFIRPLFKILLFNEHRIFKKMIRHADYYVSMMNSFLVKMLKLSKREKTQFDKVFYLGRKKHNITNSEPSTKLQFLESIKDKFIVIFVGTFGQVQNPRILIECAKQLQNNENIHFVLAGEGDTFLECKLESEGLSNVTMTGWLSDNEVVLLGNYAKVGVLPVSTFIEAFNNKTFTYFASGLPIITSIQGELRELSEKEKLGLYYPPGDIRALQDCILKLYDNKELYEQMKTNVERIFPERFDADRIYEDFASHIEKCVENYKRSMKN